MCFSCPELSVSVSQEVAQLNQESRLRNKSTVTVLLTRLHLNVIGLQLLASMHLTGSELQFILLVFFWYIVVLYIVSGSFKKLLEMSLHRL